MKRIRWLVLRMGVPASELDDVMQEILQRVWETRDQIDPEKDVPAWLDHLARNLACDHLRRLRRRAEVLTPFDETEVPDERPGPEESARTRARSSLLLRLIDEIDPGRRALFFEHELLERPLVEIAAEQGIPDETAKKRHRLARQDLKAAAKRWQAKQRTRGSDGMPVLLLPLWEVRARAWVRGLTSTMRRLGPRGPAFAAASSVILVTQIWPVTWSALPPKMALDAMGGMPGVAAAPTAVAGIDRLAATAPEVSGGVSRTAGATGADGEAGATGADGEAGATGVPGRGAGAATGELATPASARDREEILIDRARATLGARGTANQVEARLLLEEHARDFPRGRLATTREVLMRQLR